MNFTQVKTASDWDAMTAEAVNDAITSGVALNILKARRPVHFEEICQGIPSQYMGNVALVLSQMIADDMVEKLANTQGVVTFEVKR